MSKARKLQIETLNKQLEILEQDCTAVAEKKLHESNPQERNNLGRQLTNIYKDMEEVETNINELKAKEIAEDEIKTRKKIAKEADKISSLIKLLTPFESDILRYAKRAYKHICPDGWEPEVPSTIQDIIDDLKEMPQGGWEHSPIERFVAWLVADNIPSLTDRKLRTWANENIEEFTALFNKVRRNRENNYRNLDSYLMVLISPSKQDSSSKQKDYFFVDAWFVPNYQNYANIPWDKRLSKPESFSKTITFDSIPELLKIFLQDIGANLSKNFTIEIFLPLDLLNEAVDTWEIDDELTGFSVSLGTEHKLVVRSYERLLHTYRYKGLWQEKWELLQQQAQAQVSMCSAFVSSDCDNLRQLFVELNKQNAIGLKLAKVPVQKGKGSVFALILKTAIPVAIWLRENSSLNCHEQIDGLLNCCIHKLPERVQAKRLDAFEKPSDSDVGHHLSLLWEDPYRLPPLINYGM